MKVNEVPEKLYLLPDDRNPNSLSICWYEAPYVMGSIEYTRTDAFIEKAVDWLRTHSEDDYFELIPDANYCGAGNLNEKRMIEEFKKYLRGE